MVSLIRWQRAISVPLKALRPHRDGSEDPVGTEVAAGLAGATIGILLNGAPGAIAGAVAAPLAAQYVTRLREEWARKDSIITIEATQAANLDDEELIRRLTENPHLTALGTKILLASRLTANETKLRALGRILGEAVAREGTAIDESFIIADALAGIEAPHVATLRALIIAAEKVLAEGRAEKPDSDRWPFLTHVAEAGNLSLSLVIPCAATLVRYGLAQQGNTYDDVGYRPTELGLALYEVLQHIENDLSDTSSDS
jgi:hypothetical protein